jgi:WD40 repeat protein
MASNRRLQTLVLRRPGRVNRAVLGCCSLVLAVASATFFKIDRSAAGPVWRERPNLSGHTSRILALAFSPDGRQLVSGDFEGKVLAWDLSKDCPLATFRHQDRVISVAYSPDGSMLATGSTDCSVKLWNMNDLEEIRTLQGHDSGVVGLAFAADGRTLITAGADGLVNLWDVTTGENRLSWIAHVKGLNCLACSPDGQTLATGSHDQTIKLWDLAGRQHGVLPERAGVYSLVFTDAGQTLISSNGNGRISVWDVAHQVAKLYLGNEGGPETGKPITALAATADGHRLVTGGLEGTVNLWDLRSGEVLVPLTKDGMWVRAVVFSADGNKIAVAPNRDFSVRVWELMSDDQKN